MPQSPAQVLADFDKKLEKLKIQSLEVTEAYRLAKEKVEHHVLLCKLKHHPINLNVIASYPKIEEYIKNISILQKEIVKLRNYYQKLLIVKL